MSTELLDKARAAVAAAKKRGAGNVRASVYRSRGSRTEWRDGKLDRLRQSTRMGLSVTLYVEGRYSSNSTSDLRPQAIDSFLDECVAATRVLAKDPHRRLPDPQRYGGRFTGELQIHDGPGAQAVTAADRQRAARALEQAARSAPGADRIISVTTSCSDNLDERAMVTSNGMEGSRRSTSFTLFAETAIRGHDQRKPEGWWYATRRHRAKLPSVESIGKEATRRAMANLGAKAEPSGEYPCVIENAVTGRLIRGLFRPLYGNAIQQKRSFLADQLDQAIASPLLTITDDPWLPAGLGSGTYDGEGMSTQARKVIDQGVLRSFFIDTYYGSKLGKEPTTGSTSNLVFTPGDKDVPQLLAKMSKGILITGFSGGNSNPATGDFSVGIRGQWIEDGKPVRPISGMNLAGNHLSFWKRLRELGGDPYANSSIGCPSLRFDAVQFSGT
ncbi:MAG: TldD/PmbA family protein [Deltaproteobacteria bacterium]|nr:TldD/PmbA family protein [Deltaproteobacteria bacterium]